ncbi:MAG: molybdopterin-binding protein [Thermoanaerobacteraceae bacterium]|nr:molybdopterin-binding protein [Thermoanaerobacteraceae bacterium]
MEMFKVKPVDKVLELLKEHFDGFKLSTENLLLDTAEGRILASDIISKIDVPQFNRSTVDGYALKAIDTFGCSESLPAFLEIIGEVNMGEETKLFIENGQCAYVPTGGMLPSGSDAVVMLEYTEKLDDITLNVLKPVSPNQNVILKGDDIKKNDILFKIGHLLKPQDIGALAAIGKSSVEVFRKPRGYIISTGDEIVSPTENLRIGQVNDINTYTMLSELKKAGANIIGHSYAKDRFEDLKHKITKILPDVDFVIISGGSSVGTKDVTVDVINSLGKPGIITHGLSVKPGKPTIIAKVGDKAIWGMPGHPVSALVILKRLVLPFLDIILKKEKQMVYKIKAVWGQNYPSNHGKEEYVMVSLTPSKEILIANPLLGKSGLISLMSKADGFVKIPANKEGLLSGEEVEIELL